MNVLYIYIKQCNDYEALGMPSTPSLPSLPDLFWYEVVAPDSVLFMGQIELFDI